MPRDFKSMTFEELVLQALLYCNEGYFNLTCYEEIKKRLKEEREKRERENV